jgi:toxin-antitoxin system PIN domain toxin
MPVSGIRLVDANVWLALAFSDHVHHRASLLWFEKVAEREALFCRVTQMALLRHLTNQTLMGKFVLNQKEAWKCYDAFCRDDRVAFSSEPPDIEEIWRTLTSSRSQRHRVWTDAYLAAFAICVQLPLSTLDHGFRQFNRLTLDLVEFSFQ